jgi:hypothetical protein
MASQPFTLIQRSMFNVGCSVFDVLHPTGRMPVPPVIAMLSFKFLSAGNVFAKVDPVSLTHFPKL